MKARHAERLLLVALLAGATLLFEAWPQIDLSISAWFYTGAGQFPADTTAWVRAVYVAVPWLGRLLFATALFMMLRAVWQQHRVSRRLWRRAAAVALCLFVGVGLIVHAALKDHWGRPRPVQVQAFDGNLPFIPALQQSRLCDSNCSFVSGHAATGFALAALGLFGAPRTRRRWLLTAIACGGMIGLLRVAQGRHFPSDIVFAFIVMWATCIACRELWLRTMVWRRRRQREGANLAIWAR